VEISVLLIDAELSVSSRDACGLKGEREKLKLMVSSAKGREGLVINIHVAISSNMFSIVNFQQGRRIVQWGYGHTRAPSVCS